MCRLTAYIGTPICAAELVLRPSRSVIRQSFDSRERIAGDGWTPGYLNGDGYGLGWYGLQDPFDTTPCVYKQVRPAWNDPNLWNLTEKLFAKILFAHVRAASPGMPVNENLCHPFKCGRYLWMHNGGIAEFGPVRRLILQQLSQEMFDYVMNQGASDSSLAFGLFLHLIGDVQVQRSSAFLLSKLEETIKVIHQILVNVGATGISLLNFVATDGNCVIATRYTVALDRDDAPCASLYFASGSRYEAVPSNSNDKSQGKEVVDYYMAHADRRPKLAIITSEPLSDDSSDWISIPNNHAVVVTSNLHILLAPMHYGTTTLNKSLAFITENYKENQISVDIQSIEKIENFKMQLDVPGGEVASSLVVSDNFLFGAGKRGTILAWNGERLSTPTDIVRTKGHFFAMAIDHSSNRLFTSSSDGFIRAFCLYQCKMQQGPIQEILQLPCDKAGGAFVLSCSDKKLFAGFRDTDIQVFDLEETANGNGDCNGASIRNMTGRPLKGSTDLMMRHCGFVFAMITYQNRFLITGSGDALVRIWDMDSETCTKTLEGHRGAVLALASTSQLLFTGSRDKSIRVYDIESNFLSKRTLLAHSDDVTSITCTRKYMISGGSDGYIFVWDLTNLACVKYINIKSVVLSLAWSPTEKSLFCSTSDRKIRAWNLSSRSFDVATSPVKSIQSSAFENANFAFGRVASIEETEESRFRLPSSLNPMEEENFERIFAALLSIQSVSSRKECYDQCWRAAKFLSNLLESAGAQVKLCMPADDSEAASNTKNPLVLTKFVGQESDQPSVFFYGHYDVQPAEEKGWNTDPWKLSSLNGYFYGRGATDNKGPILSFIFSVIKVLRQKKLRRNVILAIEGHGETANEGFRDMILSNLDWIGKISVIMKANSYWVDDETPCLIYGMRGLINLKVEVTGPSHNLHSGIDGGIIVEPTADLIGILDSLTIPGFFEEVLPPTQEEKERLEKINFDVGRYCIARGLASITAKDSREALEQRWFEPSISITSLTTSNTSHVYGVIPKQTTAKISVRTVPNQNGKDLAQRIEKHIFYEFSKRRSPNRLTVTCENIGEWWVENTSRREYEIAENAIRNMWKISPFLCREGGTMSVTAFLQETFRASVLQVPVGQSSDGAHLANERIRIENVRKGREVFTEILEKL